ncbi:MAG: hypothetical protein HGA23_02760, partial [Bacteroidales bacterium]|nr:hypothetical protein [Bacteroidales bacterium]
MNTWISWKNSRFVFLILLAIIFLSHLPFIDSDPDRNMSVGRGPFTDEGLNTIQIRNWVNHGTLSLSECDNLLKTPLLGFPLAVTYKVFGTSHEVSRLHILTLVFLALLWIGLDKKNSRMMIILLLITLMQYQVFQSSHFSMAEMLSVAAVLLSIHFLARSSDPAFPQKKRDKQVILSGVFLSVAYFIKIQFIYLVLLLPIIILIQWFTTNYFIRRKVIRQGFIVTATLLFFLIFYLLAWYLPNKETYDYMMAHQSGEFVLSKKIWEYIRFNLNYHFLKGWVQWFVYIFLIFSVAGFIILKKTRSKRYPVLYFSSLIWFLLELHKMTMAYLPTRYQVSLFVSMGLLMSVVSKELLEMPASRWKLLIRPLTIAGLIILAFINIYNYADTLKHRTYAIRDTNEYLSNHLNQEDIVLGAWAPSLTWDSKSKALPVWNNFLNYKDPISTLKPEVIVAE